jgi:hypothetical protein
MGPRECLRCHNFIRVFNLMFELYLIRLTQHDGREQGMIENSKQPEVLRQVRDLIREYQDASQADSSEEGV